MDNKYSNVTVILCTHKFVKYAEEQIVSIKNQINVKLKIIVSIDSSDNDVILLWTQLINKYFDKTDYKIINGPKKGFSYNFISALISSEVNCDFIAFSDHDDIWSNDKLYSAIKLIKSTTNENDPVLYASRTKYVDNNRKFITLSKNRKKTLSFKNAIVQCYAGGNTMVFNKKLYSIIKNIGLVDVKSHDWWLYIVATAVEGKIIYDKNSYISYRQHNDNISGGNLGIYQILIRIKSLFSGDFRVWNKKNIYYLQKNMNIINVNNTKTLNEFIKIQNGNICERFFYYFKSGIYRQNFLDNIALFIFALLKKI